MTSARLKPDVLIVDDDPKTVAILRIALEHKGYQVREANDVDAGLAKLEERMPNVVILDFLFPKKGGVDALEAIRQQPTYAHIPVILLTNYSNMDVLEPIVEKYEAKLMIKTETKLQEIVETVEKLRARSA